MSKLKKRSSRPSSRPVSKRPKYTYPKLTEEERENRRYWREEKKRVKESNKEVRANHRREMKVLNLMKKQDVLYHHHSSEDSLLSSINTAIQLIKEQNKENIELNRDEYYDEKYITDVSQKYDPYIWNYQDGNTLPLCQFGCIWSSVDGFTSIYDVPLDGTYRFHIYDSGQRGLGSFNRITATKIETKVIPPKVNPGAFPPVTAN